MDFALFNHFPEPIIYIESGKICYSNQAVLDLEPQWTAGTELPAVLLLEPDEEGVFSCTLGGQEFQAAATRLEEGLLLVMRRPAPAAAHLSLAALSIQLREQLNNIQPAARDLSLQMKECEAEACDTPKEKARMERTRKYLGMLNQSFHRLLRLVRHLELAEQAGRKNRPSSAAQPLDLVELCRTAADGAACLASQAGVTFQVDIPNGSIWTMGDRELLEIMLLELISNAIKFAGKDGTVGLKFSYNGRQVLITISDDGPGMSQAGLTTMLDGTPPEKLPKPGDGLGLGLSIARYAAAVHGGAILLESPGGCGLRAIVSLKPKKPVKGMLRTPRVSLEGDDGFSMLHIFLSDVLPWQAFENGF